MKQPGQHFDRKKAASEPLIHYNATPSKFLLLNLDLDAPFSSFPILAPVLHSMHSNLNLSEAKDEGGFAQLTKPTGKQLGVDWAAPNPPLGAGPHRYVYLLYEKPESFNIKNFVPKGGMTIMGRMRFDLDRFEKKAGLEKAVPGNWFVSN